MSSPILESQAHSAAALVAVDGRTYPLEKADVIARAEGGVALSTLVQSYANPYDEALELTYTLPLPADGAVLGYTIRVGEKLIRAEVQPREKANQAYRDALFAGRTAGLLEQTRINAFQQKLGNVPPRTKVEITIDVLHPLAFVFASPAMGRGDTPHWEYRFPTVVGVRYHGASGRVPDQADLSPDRGDIPARVSLSLTLTDAARNAAHSPTHAIESVSLDGASLVTFREGERLDRDVVVRWEAASDAVGARVVEGAGLEGDDGRYALVTLVPPAVTTSSFHRDVTVLIDTSGSMAGEPLAVAKRVVGEFVGSLEEGDRFELLEFSNDVRRFARGLQKVTPDSLRKAHEWLGRLHAAGGTEMAGALAEALHPEREDAQRQVVLVTDGDISFEAEVVAGVAAAQNVRLHVVGVGLCPNRALTQQAAAAGRGLELLAGDESAASSVAARLVAGTARPVLTHVRVEGTAVVGEQREWLRDVFAGQPLLVTVELGPKGGTLEVRGDLAGSREPWIESIHVPQAGGALSHALSPLPLGALHGRSVVGELEIRRAVKRGPDATAIDARIEALGMRHRIATSRTSMVAFEETPSVDPKQPRRRVRLAVEVPAGVSAEAVGLECMEPAAAMMGVSYRKVMSRPPVRSASDAMSNSRSLELPWNLRDETDAMTGFTPPPVVEISATEARWLGHKILLVELVTPVDGFWLPGGELSVRVATPDGRDFSVKGTVVASESSPRGPHVAGMVVRFAISFSRMPTWKAAGELKVMWWPVDEADRPDFSKDAWVLRFDAPERPEDIAK